MFPSTPAVFITSLTYTDRLQSHSFCLSCYYPFKKHKDAQLKTESFFIVRFSVQVPVIKPYQKQATESAKSEERQTDCGT